LEYLENNFKRPNSLYGLRHIGLTPTWAIWCNGNTPKLGWNGGGKGAPKTRNISETVQARTEVTITD